MPQTLEICASAPSQRDERYSKKGATRGSKYSRAIVAATALILPSGKINFWCYYGAWSAARTMREGAAAAPLLPDARGRDLHPRLALLSLSPRHARKMRRPPSTISRRLPWEHVFGCRSSTLRHIISTSRSPDAAASRRAPEAQQLTPRAPPSASIRTSLTIRLSP